MCINFNVIFIFQLTTLLEWSYVRSCVCACAGARDRAFVRRVHINVSMLEYGLICSMRSSSRLYQSIFCQFWASYIYQEDKFKRHQYRLQVMCCMFRMRKKYTIHHIITWNMFIRVEWTLWLKLTLSICGTKFSSGHQWIFSLVSQHVENVWDWTHFW